MVPAARAQPSCAGAAVCPSGPGISGVSRNESVRRKTPRAPVHSEDRCGNWLLDRARRRDGQPCAANAPGAQPDRIPAPLQMRAYCGRIRTHALHCAAYFQWRGAKHPAPVTQAGLLLEVDPAHQRYCRHNPGHPRLADTRRIGIHGSFLEVNVALMSQRPCHAAPPRIRRSCSPAARARSASCQPRLTRSANCASRKSYGARHASSVAARRRQTHGHSGGHSH